MGAFTVRLGRPRSGQLSLRSSPVGFQVAGSWHTYRREALLVVGNRVEGMASLDAAAVSKLLRKFGQHTALRPGNPYRAKAYARAADNLLALSLPLGEVCGEARHWRHHYQPDQRNEPQ